MKNTAKFNIIVTAENIIDYVFSITDRMPKKTRCDILVEIRRASLKALESVIRANNVRIDKTAIDAELVKTRSAQQNEAKITTMVLMSLISVAHKQKYITTDQCRNATSLCDKLLSSIFNWQKSDIERYQPSA